MAAGLNGILRGVHGDLRGAIIELSGEGWTPTKTNGGHIRLDHPSAARPVFAASTPSDFRAPDNLRRDCRGALRAPLHCLSDPLSADDAISTLQAHKAKRKARKRRSSFIESAGQRVVDNITQVTSKSAPKPVKCAAPESGPPVTKPAPSPMRAETTPRAEMREMKMTSDITSAEGPVIVAAAEPFKTAKKPSDSAKGRKVRAAAAPAAPRTETDAIALGIQIGLRIASGDLMQIPITAEMVGKTLIMERGDTYWVTASVPVMCSDEKKPSLRRNRKFNDAILAFLEDLKGDEVPISLIADHMIESGLYKASSARPGVVRRLKQLAQEGLVTYRSGPGEPYATHLS